MQFVVCLWDYFWIIDVAWSNNYGRYQRLSSQIFPVIDQAGVYNKWNVTQFIALWTENIDLIAFMV